MKIPRYNNRKMQEVKKYPNFILFEDRKTGIKQCFSYEQLDRIKDKPKGGNYIEVL